MRMRSWLVRAWCRLTGAYPVWLKDDAGRIHIKVARRRFDPFSEEQDLVIIMRTQDHRGTHRLDPSGTVTMNYGRKWRWKHARRDLHVETVLRR